MLASAPMTRLEKRLLGLVARASSDFGLLEPNDRVLVAVSGGKDSHALLYLLREVQRRAPFPFSLVAVNLDQGQPGFPSQVLPEYFAKEGYEHRIVVEDTYSIVKDKVPEGKTYCSLCSRLRRGILYNVAEELGATKIALGHHRDDVIETLVLNLFYSGQLKAMPPRLRSDDGRNVVIRPLVYCSEADLAAFAAEREFPIVPCNLCGSQDNLQRKRVKELLTRLDAENPKVRANVFAALGNVRPTHIYDLEVRRRFGVEEAHGPDEFLEPSAHDTLGAGLVSLSFAKSAE
ncbi:MAG: tRNA 2-thiocytidine(32) synthetase TtcA [Polyangiaceae bacterium]|nr:tRNA 2-thiocytidine(32) synthetase TtcA [Polyangiaceae bacterium]MCE7893008.1 tRNA 2-thiocytidine(32) synthetase TtcA [Sorangiineae bacterium PRO1]MCL4752916.1 tRNA 2-thiocytidine(32) synthetase TtcA [Myxococcales bacterium]